MDPDFMVKEQQTVNDLIGMLILLPILTFLLGLSLGYAVSQIVSPSGSTTVDRSSKGDLLICPKPPQKRSVALVSVK
jgi:hypothetical protein